LLSITFASTFSLVPEMYLLIPTITSEPESILAYLLAALSSILALGIPVSIALAIPPKASTSSIILIPWS